MSEIHDVLHELIDVAAGVKARLSVHEANLLHEGVDKALADATDLDSPDSSPEPASDPAANEGNGAAQVDVFAPAPPVVSNAGEPVAG
jgi:hypothetical protein